MAAIKVSPTLYETELRISSHRGYKFIPALTLLSLKTRIEWPPVLTATASFLSNIQGNIQAFRPGLLWWQKLTCLIQQFLYDLLTSQWKFAFPVNFPFHYIKSDRSIKHDSGVIFLDQSQLFAPRSNQEDRFIFDRQYITSNNGYFVFTKVGKCRLSSNSKRFWN